MRFRIQKIIFCFVILLTVVWSAGCHNTKVAVWNKEDAGKVTEITNLTVNYQQNPIGIENTPQFGWRMESDVEGQLQTAYRIVVAKTAKQLEAQEYVWDSGKRTSGISVAIPYEGADLMPETSYRWKVYVWDKGGEQLESHEEAFFEMGVTDKDWEGASWIGIRKEPNIKAVTHVAYQITYNVKLGKTYSGFVWGMDTNQYGDYFRCDFNTLGEDIVFSVVEFLEGEEYAQSVKLNQDFSEVFGSLETFIEKEHCVVLEVNGTTLHAYVDGIQVMETSIRKEKDVENIGFWTDRGPYYAYYDNISIINKKDNSIVYEEGFNNSQNNIFSPYYIKVLDGWCEVSSGFLLTSGVEEPAPMLRRNFICESASSIVTARLYATALGDYRIYLNGKDICEEYLSPGRSIYSKETYYRTYDVISLLKELGEENVIGAVLGHGRYNKSNTHEGENIAFQAKLVIQYADGSRQTIVTDHTWQAYADGPIRNDDMFLGEVYDATKEQAGWSESGYNASQWQQADVFAEYNGLDKKACEAPAVKCLQRIAPIQITEPIKGTYVYDFGQNFNGNCEITFRDTTGKAGQVVTMRYAEALNDEKLSCKDDTVGTIWTQNLFTADNTDYYIMSGAGEETYTPSLVCRGFRYVQVSGIEEPIASENISGLVLSTDNKNTGSFFCSDEKVNRLYESIYWTQRSNFLDVPTDCPQRDERFGWTGDAQVFANTASYNADIYNYLRKYTMMLIAGQDENGAFPEIAPSVGMSSAANGWSDAGVILVWELYQQYGDAELIRENLDAMCRYVDHLVDTSEDYVRTEHHYGDHNAISGLDDDIANTAQCAYVARLLAKMSADIGENEIANKYTMIYNQYKRAWQEHYINEDGSIDCWLQSAYTLGLAYGLYPDELEEKGAACLNSAVIANDNHLNTGYIATQFLLPVLCKYGYIDTAYRILRQDTYPSWNDMLALDQTTITEAWNGRYDTEDGTYAIYGSLNHFGLGTVGQWFYSDVLGIKRDETSPGFKHFYLCPLPGGGLTYAKGSYECVYGTIESSWEVNEDEFVFRFVIPANTTATVTLPDAQYQNMELGAGTYEYHIALGVKTDIK